MIRAYLGKFGFTAVLVGLLGLAWGMKGTQFGQDLAGGAELRYSVTKRIVERLKTLIDWRGEVDDPAKEEELKRLLARRELELKDATGPRKDRLDREVAELQFRLDRDRLDDAIRELKRQQSEVGKGAEIVRDRLDPDTIQDIEVRTVGEAQLLIRIPYSQPKGKTEQEAKGAFEKRVQEIKTLVERQGVLTLNAALKAEDHTKEYEDAIERKSQGRPIKDKYYYVIPKKDYDEVAKKLAERGIDDPLSAGYLPWAPPAKDRRTGEVAKHAPLLIYREQELDGSIVDRAYVRMGDEGLEVSLEFTAAGRGRFEEVSGRHVGEQLAIILDEVCHSAPVIKERISGSARISGSFTQAEADTLSKVLTAGSLPVRIEYQSQKVVGPSLGRDSIRAGLTAALIGSAAVLVFVLLYYLAGGVVASIGLVMNLVIIMGALAAFNAKLTLPGIAGLVLTIGMAVDANVLIFERIREEKASGKTLRLAVQSGYDRAFITIIDANLTTLITAIILYWFGTGPVRGFAVTLTLGILGSLFTSLYASRAMIEYLVVKGWIKSFTMLKIIGRPSFPFMGVRPVAYFLSAVLVAGGLFSFFSYRDKYGIDFEGGAMLFVALEAPMSDEEMREHASAALDEMQRAENEGAASQERSPLDFGSVRVQAAAESLAAKMGRASKTYSLITRMDVDQLGEYKGLLAKRLEGKLHPEGGFPSEEAIGKAVSQELGRAATAAIVFSLVMIFLYILMRFEFNPSFGVGAVVALAHDVALTAGAMALVDRLGIIPAKIDLPAVAALLTIVGYSLNDTIVVFDRIRETRLRVGKKMPLREIVDEAVNGVLARTLITSFTTFLAAGALFVFGGEATRGFAFAILVGVLVGTYSSIFVASPVVVEWEKLRERPGLKRAVAAVAGVAVLLAFAGLIAQSLLTARENERRETSKLRIERKIEPALRAYVNAHEGEYPENLRLLVDEGYLRDASALGGPDAETGIAYDYVSGLRSGDPPGMVLLYEPAGLHRGGGHLLFIDGRILWKDQREIAAKVRATTAWFEGDPERKIRIVPARPAP